MPSPPLNLFEGLLCVHPAEDKIKKYLDRQEGIEWVNYLPACLC
jgi:hypothetical protein